jgi:translation initiation factor 2B subunit (eIF-2B alpha/beta/delta family)
MGQTLRQTRREGKAEFLEEQEAFGDQLIKTRPTAILLASGVRLLMDSVKKGTEQALSVSAI